MMVATSSPRTNKQICLQTKKHRRGQTQWWLLLGQCANTIQLVRFFCTGPVSEVQLVTRLCAHSVQPQDTIGIGFLLGFFWKRKSIYRNMYCKCGPMLSFLSMGPGEGTIKQCMCPGTNKQMCLQTKTWGLTNNKTQKGPNPMMLATISPRTNKQNCMQTKTWLACNF